MGGQVLYREAVSAFRILLRALTDFVFPPCCAVCSGSMADDERIVCEGCWSRLELLSRASFCPRCGLPWTGETDDCPGCAGRLFRFSGAGVLARFGPTCQQIIHQLKYAGKRSLAGRLGALLADAVLADDRLASADRIVPVPLHASRLRERGYNQSALIARSLGECMGLPVDERSLRRTRPTRSQTGLSAEARRRNVSGAFRATSPERIEGQRLLLVDDVVTTGATADACAGTLVDAGAREVFVVAVARPEVRIQNPESRIQNGPPDF